MPGILDMMNTFKSQMTESPPQYFTTGAGGQRTYTPQYTGANNAPLTQSQWQTQYGQPSGGGSPEPVPDKPEPKLLPTVNTSGPSDEIRRGYDEYQRTLDTLLNQNLPSQRTAQEGIANTQFDRGVSSLGTQRDLQQQGLEGQKKTVAGQQKKTLADIANNIRNSFMAGNIYLGARGAGDSSAANQYSYALTKMGSEQRGNANTEYAGIQNQIMERENALATTYAGQLKDLEFERNEKVGQIASWFNEQQNALRQAQASGQLSKSKDLATISQNMVNIALQQLETIRTEQTTRRGQLDTWAMGVSKNVEELKKNMQGVSSLVDYTNQQVPPLAGINQQTGSALPMAMGYRSSTEEKKLFPYDN